MYSDTFMYLGNTAYFGFLELCQPKAGETVAVTGAAGAVGSLVGQIAKMKGCRVIGFAGTDEKCDFLINTCGFDKAYNYKKTRIEDALQDGAPNGIDCFFDCVGGHDAAMIINHMNLFGRITVPKRSKGLLLRCPRLSLQSRINH